MSESKHIRPREHLTRSDATVLAFIERHPGKDLHSKNDIVPGTGYPAGTVGASLTTLVASGFVKRLGGGRYRLADGMQAG